jgi:hypothetical protein
MTNIISIVPKGEERKAQLASAFTDFEGRLSDLYCMAQLTLDAVQDLDHPAPPDDQVNLAMFSARHLFEMIAAAQAEWHAKWRAAGGNADDA